MVECRGALMVVRTREEMVLRIVFRPYRASWVDRIFTQASGAALLQPVLVYDALTGLADEALMVEWTCEEMVLRIIFRPYRASILGLHV